MSKLRAYCFTLNNYSDDDITEIKKVECSYLVFGKEVGESGTPHLQGFIHFTNPRTMTGVKKDKAFKKAHLEVSEAPKKAIEYCKKGEQSHSEWVAEGTKGASYGKNFEGFEKGEFKQGARNDLTRVYEEVKNGKSADDVAWDEPSSYDAASRTILKLEDIRLRKLRRSEMTEGVWLFGETGVGKSEWAYEQGGTSFYSYPYDGGWWDGYKCEPCVIIDEFRGQLPYNELLRMVDKHPNYYVRRRCREPMPFCSLKVIVTSSLPPWKVFKNLDEKDSLNQLFRRFKIYEKTKDEVKLIDPNDYIED